MNNKFSYERYSRQTLLKGFGEAGQEKLLQAKVLVIGAGGLGCPALQYLAAAGVGTIGIVDNDVVSLSNLHRQPLYATSDIGLFKSDTAAKKLGELNPEISIIVYNERLTSSNALEILFRFDIIIDGSDNFATRYLVNDACVLLDKPLVYGAVSQFEGQIGVFNFHSSDNIPAVNYRDLFPQPPKENEVLNCAEAGVLGVLPGIIGTMQASETIKLITGIGKPLINSLLTFNALNNQFYEISLQANPETRSLIPATKEDFESMNYEWLCAAERSPREIDINRFDELIAVGDTILIDVREPHELPVVTEFKHQRIPMSILKQALINTDAGTIVVFCQSGKRSLEAAEYIFGLNDQTRNIYSLKGGILQWINQHQKKEKGMTVHKPKNIFVQGPVSPSFIAESIQKHSSKTEIGGHSIFLGQVRADSIDGKKVAAIDYTAYEELALEKMHAIREAIFAKYPLSCMHVYHSLGKVAAGEICLFVFTSGAHRKEAIDACEETVERLKAELPIWGKELFEDETHQWKVNK